ncbi:MAG: A/G-specific adenine glycosylase [Alphaproteobacteria bacterium]|nr:A/G-specific adenine glycosylase [Alphaproteobacteria bacterium]
MKHRSSSRKTAPQIKPSEILGFHRALDIWYQLHGRHDLPWRLTKDPYAIWLSEVMLQQTQVATVRDRYYGQFLRQFPTVSALARAPLPKLLKAWEGMGYYRRAVNLHKAAQQIAPALPTTFEELIELPGIGKNTAHAILAFAYRKPHAVLEANVKRVVARIFAETDEKKLWEHAELMLNRENPFDYNQAMMDVGAMICTPKAPKCKECPAMQICKGRKNPTAYPAAKTKKAVPTKKLFILVKQDANGRLFLEARESKLLGGLYGFEQTPTSPKNAVTLGVVKHVYSHFKLEASVMLISSATSNSPNWHTKDALQKLPLSKLDQKVLELIDAAQPSR